MGLIYEPLHDLRSLKFTGQKKIGLRNKPLEIQEMFSLGKKNQIASIKNQFKEKKHSLKSLRTHAFGVQILLFYV
jgi:hypothetical protein